MISSHFFASSVFDNTFAARGQMYFVQKQKADDVPSDDPLANSCPSLFRI